MQVTSEDGTMTQDYVVTVGRGSIDATLSALSLSPGTLSPLLDPAMLTGYTANVGTAASLMVTATPADSAATITVSGTQTDGNTPLTISGTTSPFTVAGLTAGTNTITVRVTSEAGTTMQDYVVTVGRGSTDATLSALSLSPGTLSPSFGSTTTAYTVDVGTATNSLMVTATPADSAATITVSGTQTDGNTPLTISGTTSPFTVAGLTDGANTITVRVTSEASTTMQDYVVTARKGLTDLVGIVATFILETNSGDLPHHLHKPWRSRHQLYDQPSIAERRAGHAPKRDLRHYRHADSIYEHPHHLYCNGGAQCGRREYGDGADCVPRGAPVSQ